MRTYKRLSLEEELELGRRVREERDLDARNTLVLHTQPLVHAIARKYRWTEVEYEDLVQEGIVGLTIAATRWDSRPGLEFKKFASWWILQTIHRLIMEYGIIRIPADVASKMYKIRRVMNELAIEYGRPPTEGEIANRSQVSLKLVQRVLRSLRIQTVSLYQPVPESYPDMRDSGEVDLLLQIADVEALRADYLLEAREELTQACDRLNHLVEVLYADETIIDQQKEMFVRFYGLDGSLQKKTFEAIGELYDTTKGPIYKIIFKIWGKLQSAELDMDHDAVLEELARIKELEKLAHKRVSAS
jgi:RNA polymerase sigma factor (sigma-70 family)